MNTRFTDRDGGNHRVLPAPGVGTRRIDTDRDIDIQTDRHAALPRSVDARMELAVGIPLHELLEFAGAEMGATKFLQSGAGRSLPGVRPLPPWLRPFDLPQHLEASKAQQRFIFSRAIAFKVRAPVLRRARGKPFVGQPQPFQLGACDAVVVDEFFQAQRVQVVGQPGRRHAGELRNGVDVDVERVEKQAAVGSVGARLRRPVWEKRVQRVEPDAAGADFAGDLDEVRKIGEVAVAPIASRAQGVKLNGQGP
jgi:hypothetical protein